MIFMPILAMAVYAMFGVVPPVAPVVPGVTSEEGCRQPRRRDRRAPEPGTTSSDRTVHQYDNGANSGISPSQSKASGESGEKKLPKKPTSGSNVTNSTNPAEPIPEPKAAPTPTPLPVKAPRPQAKSVKIIFYTVPAGSRAPDSGKSRLLLIPQSEHDNLKIWKIKKPVLRTRKPTKIPMKVGSGKRT